MKIALLGPPGAGKTKVAKAIVRKLYDGQDKWAIVDGYVDKLRKQTGLPYGGDTDYVQEIQVLGARWAAEDAVELKGRNSITCGTIYESIIYATAQSVRIRTDELDMVKQRLYVQTMMQAFGSLQQMTFDYNALFLLPWGKDHVEHSWGAVVNQHLAGVLQSFSKFAVILKGTHQEKVNDATEVITSIIGPTPSLPKDEQPTV